ncbi:unnamed protein product [Prunus armeniaca]
MAVAALASEHGEALDTTLSLLSFLFGVIYVYGSSAVAGKLCQQPSLLGLHPLAALVDSYCELEKFGHCTTYVYREKNGVADCLANWSHNLDLGLFILDTAPSWVSSCVGGDVCVFLKLDWSV